MRRGRRVYVPLVGGLGNQLFGLAYCLWLRENGFRATPFSNVRRSHTKFHPQHFDLLHQAATAEIPLRAASKAQSWFLKGLASLAGFLQSAGIQVSLVETRSAAGDVALPRRQSKIVRGYFQDPRVAQSSLPALRKVVSSSYNPEVSKAGYWGELKAPIITIHYRRGDYLNHSQTFGLLSNDYFVRACELARQESGINSVRIISDGDSRPLEMELREKGFRCEALTTDAMSPMQLLWVFSRLQGYLAVSNSSFSWWGAALNKTVNVICPEPWFRSEELVSMSLPTWRTFEAEWDTSTSLEM